MKNLHTILLAIFTSVSFDGGLMLSENGGKLWELSSDCQ